MVDNSDVRIRVAGIIIEDGKLLLIAHKKNGDIYWLLPGGGVSYGESLEEALQREFKEELNIDVDVFQPQLICDSIDPSGDRHILNICFNCTHSDGELLLGDDERLHNFAYFSRNDLEHISLYPPINNDLIDILEGKNQKLYIGKLWLKNEK